MDSIGLNLWILLGYFSKLWYLICNNYIIIKLVIKITNLNLLETLISLPPCSQSLFSWCWELNQGVEHRGKDSAISYRPSPPGVFCVSSYCTNPTLSANWGFAQSWKIIRMLTTLPLSIMSNYGTLSVGATLVSNVCISSWFNSDGLESAMKGRINTMEISKWNISRSTLTWKESIPSNTL